MTGARNDHNTHTSHTARDTHCNGGGAVERTGEEQLNYDAKYQQLKGEFYKNGIALKEAYAAKDQILIDQVLTVRRRISGDWKRLLSGGIVGETE